MPAKTTTPPDVTAELAYLTRALMAPTMRQAIDRLADRARAEDWSHEQFLAACLEREVTARSAHGGELRVKAAKFPARKSLDDFDYAHASSIKRDQIAHLGTLDFITAKENVIFLGPPGTGKTHLATGLGIKACHAGHRVEFATAADWVTRLADAHHAGKFPDELKRLGRIPLLVIDEIGYLPFEPEAANLFFQLISARYERASVIVTSNKPFSRWGEVFGDDTVAAAMIDRLVHHAEIVAIKATPTGSRTATSAAPHQPTRPTSHREGSIFTHRPGVSFQSALTLALQKQRFGGERPVRALAEAIVSRPGEASCFRCTDRRDCPIPRRHHRTSIAAINMGRRF